MAKKIVFQWELVNDHHEGKIQTLRAKVMGGWILKTIIQDVKMKVFTSNVLFIADTDWQWQPIEPYVDPKVVKANIAEDFKA